MSTNQPPDDAANTGIDDFLVAHDATFDRLRDPFPAHLVALAAGGLVSDEEARLLLQHEPSRRRLAHRFDHDPPRTPTLAYMLLHNRPGALRVLAELHLDTGTPRALHTRKRMDEISALAGHVDVLEWIARSYAGHFLSFDKFGRPSANPLDFGADVVVADESQTVRVYAQVGPGDVRSEVILETSKTDRAACMIFVYRKANNGLNETLAAVTSPVLLDSGDTSPVVSFTLDMALSEMASLRAFLGSSDSFPERFKGSKPRLLVTRAKVPLPGTRHRRPPEPRPTSAPARDRQK